MIQTGKLGKRQKHSGLKEKEDKSFKKSFELLLRIRTSEITNNCKQLTIVIHLDLIKTKSHEPTWSKGTIPLSDLSRIWIGGINLPFCSLISNVMDDGQPMPKSAISEKLSGSDSVKHKSECHSPAHIKGPLLDSLTRRDGPPYHLQPWLKCFGVVLALT